LVLLQLMGSGQQSVMATLLPHSMVTSGVKNEQLTSFQVLVVCIYLYHCLSLCVLCLLCTFVSSMHMCIFFFKVFELVCNHCIVSQ